MSHDAISTLITNYQGNLMPKPLFGGDALVTSGLEA